MHCLAWNAITHPCHHLNQCLARPRVQNTVELKAWMNIYTPAKVTRSRFDMTMTSSLRHVHG